MDWCIVIPSYNRVDTLKNKTLSVLKQYKIPKHLIHVFVANKEQKELYDTGVGNDVGKIIVGEKVSQKFAIIFLNTFQKENNLYVWTMILKVFLNLTRPKNVMKNLLFH